MFHRLQAEYPKQQYPPDRIYNDDEAGLIIVMVLKIPGTFYKI